MDFQKRLDQIQENASDSPGKSVGGKRYFFLSFLLLVILSFVLRSSVDSIDVDYSSSDFGTNNVSELTDRQLETVRAQKRSSWLAYTGVGLIFAGVYEALGEAFLWEDPDEFDSSATEEEGFNFSMDGFTKGLGTWMTVSFLRLLFAFLMTFPLWLFAFWLARKKVAKETNRGRSSSILGYCSNSGGPFYSGIYGPFKPNQSLSGTDFSCPGLACPAMVSEEEASKHPAANLLRKAKAMNQTNLDLLRVILAHKNYPAEVLEERSTEDEDAEEMGAFVSSEAFNLEQSLMEGLKAVLGSHIKLKQVFKETSHPEEAERKALSFEKTTASIEKAFAKDSELSQNLASSLSPAKAKALASTPATLVATAYLATEAGKALVYEPMQDLFSRASVYPHLQARAVLHSLESYHNNYKGDGRMVIRQAILCSRRHGDFGRAFLPVRMPLQSRAIRDWLELLYTPKPDRSGRAKLIALDSYLEELHNSFREKISSEETNSENCLNGTPYKSVVLIPLEKLIDFSFKNIDGKRLRKITELLEETREIQENLSISARLPGFKRQALEAAKCKTKVGEILAEINSKKGGEKLIERWTILRRTLTRYNWLSTRVGDEGVPEDGLIQSSISGELHGTLVPLRQRRFEELLGSDWEEEYFPQRVNPRDVRVFKSPSEFKKVGGSF